MKKLIIAFTALVLISGCHKEEKVKSTDTRDIPGGKANLVIPKSVWKKIETEFGKSALPAEGAAEGGGEAGGEGAEATAVGRRVVKPNLEGIGSK
jgi:hypothetical protein